jgi:hypothetical protein
MPRPKQQPMPHLRLPQHMPKHRLSPLLPQMQKVLQTLHKQLQLMLRQRLPQLMLR